MVFFIQNLKQQKERREQFSQGSVVDTLPPAAMPGSILQRSNAARTMGQSGSDTVAIDMDHLDNRPHMSNDMSQMQIVEQQVRQSHIEDTCSVKVKNFSLQKYLG